MQQVQMMMPTNANNSLSPGNQNNTGMPSGPPNGSAPVKPAPPAPAIDEKKKALKEKLLKKIRVETEVFGSLERMSSEELKAIAESPEVAENFYYGTSLESSL